MGGVRGDGVEWGVLCSHHERDLGEPKRSGRCQTPVLRVCLERQMLTVKGLSLEVSGVQWQTSQYVANQICWEDISRAGDLRPPLEVGAVCGSGSVSYGLWVSEISGE